MDFFNNLSSSDFMPHGHCYFWEPYIVWSNAISDSVIAIAYMTIPMSLLFIFRKRQDFSYIWMMLLFAIFILGCGTTHIFDVINIWKPYYRIDSAIRIITALASIGTAIMLIKITPGVILIPSAAEWKRVNEQLKKRIQELKEKDKTINAFKHFEYLAETLPQLVWIANPSGEVTFYNQRWYQYTGLPFYENLYKALEEVVHPQHSEKVFELWEKSVRTGAPFEVEVCIKSISGLYRWHLARALPVKTDDLPIFWVCTLTNIHDQKKYNQQLEEKNRQLTQINTDLDNFIYTASHDLRSPISNLEGLVSALNVRKNNEEEIKEHISKSVRRLKTTIDELTEISKIQKGVDAEKEHVDLEKMLTEVKEDLADAITESNIEISTTLGIKEVYFSRRNLRTIILNLLGNSIKYRSADRPPLINISTYADKDFTVLSVSDNGIGFDMEKVDVIFKMFRRLHAHVEGTGVGLYIVKRIVENSGGKLVVNSEIDKGTTFKIYFRKRN